MYINFKSPSDKYKGLIWGIDIVIHFTIVTVQLL